MIMQTIKDTIREIPGAIMYYFNSDYREKRIIEMSYLFNVFVVDSLISIGVMIW